MSETCPKCDAEMLETGREWMCFSRLRRDGSLDESKTCLRRQKAQAERERDALAEMWDDCDPISGTIIALGLHGKDTITSDLASALIFAVALARLECPEMLEFEEEIS